MISKDLEKFIKDLSQNDRKTLTQKTAKLFEEGGELSKKVLGYDGIYGSNHRIIKKEDILEELADIFLVNMSMVYNLGIDSKTFESKLFEKAQVWQNIQAKEDRAILNGDLMPYEIHITVSNPEGIDIDTYKKDCATIGVKPILLALQDKKGAKIMSDVMTSSRIYGTNNDALVEMKRISNELSNMGYNVIREKIEASYWHQKAPFREDGDTKMPQGCYFECHLNIECTEDRMPELSDIALKNDCHLSSNVFKMFDDGSFTIMMTYRNYNDVYEDFKEKLEIIKADLFAKRFKVEKEIAEFSIYDTNLSHDSKWLGL